MFTKKIRRLSVLFLVLVIGLISGCAGNEQATNGDSDTEPGEKKTIQIAYPLGEGTISHMSAQLFEKEVEAELGDKIDIQLAPDGQLGDDVAVLEGLRIGTHDATIIATPITTIDSRFSFFDLPYLFTTREEVEKITNGPIGEKLLNSLEDSGIKGLAYWHSGWRNITTSIKPIESPADLDGLKIRTPSSPSRVELFKLLGSNPTPLPYSELFSALQQKVVEGQENPDYVITSLKLYEVQDYLSMTKHVYTPNYLLFSKPLWDSLSDDVKQVLEDKAKLVAEESWKLGEELTEETLNTIKDHMEVNEPNLEQFKEIAKPMYKTEEFIEPIGQELMDEILETLGK